MHRKFSLILTLTAWCFATGSQWDVAQTFGWARMFAAYAQTLPVIEALEKTFSGQELCGICEIVQDARQDAQGDSAAHAAAKPTGKVPEAIAPALLVIHGTAVPPPRPTAGRIPAGEQRGSPPTPPPRAAA